MKSVYISCFPFLLRAWADIEVEILNILDNDLPGGGFIPAHPINTQWHQAQGCQVKTEGPVKRPVYQVQGLSIWSYLPLRVT